MTQQILSQTVVNIANDDLMIAKVLQPKIDRIMTEAAELGNPLTVGMAIVHALRHGIVTHTEGLGLMLNNHVI